MFPDRSGEIPFFKAEALAAWKRCEFDTARMHFFKFVESVKQQNVNTGGRLEAELHEAQGLVDLLVVVGIETNLVDVERLGAVDVGDRDGDEFDLPVHARTLSRRT